MIIPKTIRVLIVDDSALVREALRSILSADPDLEVVGTARDGREGVEAALRLRPDVVTMDLKMPVMDGFGAIKEIMTDGPVPVIVVSSMDVERIKKALDIGAMDFVPVTGRIEEVTADLIDKLKIAARVKPIRSVSFNAKAVLSVSVARGFQPAIVAVGISTGGPQALRVLLSRLPADLPAGILIVQHMSEGFISGLAEWLDSATPLEVSVARDGEKLNQGTIMFAPDGRHLRIDAAGRIRLSLPPEPRKGHIPSIDVMMKSVAGSYGERAAGVIMTGMGRDGVEGIKAIKGAGGVTIAQDEESSVVFGMNREAIKTGSVDVVLPLESIAGELIRILKIVE